MILHNEDIQRILRQLIQRFEYEVVEFKEAKDNFHSDDLGKYFSAISNEANLKGKQYGWLIFGVNNKRAIIGTSFKNSRDSLDALKHSVSQNTSEGLTFIEIYETNVIVEGAAKRVVMFQIPAAVSSIPTAWKGHYYGRNGESLSPLNMQELEYIRSQGKFDWSKQIIEKARINDLDKDAILLARENYKKKNASKEHLIREIDSLDDISFLNKIKLTLDGKITNAAMLLLGKEESDYLFDGYNQQITWRLIEKDGRIKDYEHFHIPFILTIDKIFSKVRNLRYRYMPNQLSLFPIETDQYDHWLIREVLHNCIAHQNYNLGNRIYVNELDDKLLFTNEGNFIPGDVETVLKPSYSPPSYRNPFLAKAMVSLNLIDTVTSGIKEIYRILKGRYFPLPDYDLGENNRVKVTIYGKILDENYTKLLYHDEALDMDTVFLLDKVQKGIAISKEQVLLLKKNHLIEGRFPNVYVSFRVAEITGEKAKYIKNKGLDDSFYKQLILEFLKKNKSATKQEITDLLDDKLSSILDTKQKINKIKYLLHTMKKNDGTITTIDEKTKNVRWVPVKQKK